MYTRIIAVLVVVVASGCGLKTGIEVGPIPMTIPMGSGTLDPTLFPQTDAPIVVGRTEQTLCSLPTEEQLTELFRSAAGYGLDSILQLSRLELRKTGLRSGPGELREVKAVHLYFLPKNGSILGSANLGGAFSLTGFDDTIEIGPRNDVDLLELIRENDALPGDDCPSIQVHAAGTVPESAIAWEAELEVDAYARVGLFIGD